MKYAIMGLVVLVFTISSVSALTQLNIYLDENGNAQFFGESSEVSMALPEGITLDNGKISGTTSVLTDKQGVEWKFAYYLGNSEIVVYLPSNAVIGRNNNGEITIRGGRITIYSKDNVDVSYRLDNENRSDYGQVVILLLIIVLVAGYFYLKMKKRTGNKVSERKKEPRRDKLKMLEGVLHERQNLILARLKETGRVKMSYLRKQCNMPKASFSRHVRELVKKKLVKLDGEGRNKFVSSV